MRSRRRWMPWFRRVESFGHWRVTWVWTTLMTLRRGTSSDPSINVAFPPSTYKGHIFIMTKRVFLYTQKLTKQILWNFYIHHIQSPAPVSTGASNPWRPRSRRLMPNTMCARMLGLWERLTRFDPRSFLLYPMCVESILICTTYFTDKSFGSWLDAVHIYDMPSNIIIYLWMVFKPYMILYANATTSQVLQRGRSRNEIRNVCVPASKGCCNICPS